MRVQPANLRHLSPSSASAQLRLQCLSPPSLFSAPGRRVPRTRQEDVPESVRTTSRPLFCSLNSDGGVQPCLAVSTFHFLIPILSNTFQERFFPCKTYLRNENEFLEKEIFLVEQSSSFFVPVQRSSPSETFAGIVGSLNVFKQKRDDSEEDKVILLLIMVSFNRQEVSMRQLKH